MKTQITLELSDNIRGKLNEFRKKPGLITRADLRAEVGQWVLDIANGILVPFTEVTPAKGLTRQEIENAVAIANVNYESKVEFWRIIEQLKKKEHCTTSS